MVGDLQSQTGAVILSSNSLLADERIGKLACTSTHIFAATQNRYGSQPSYLWVSDGTQVGTRPLTPDFASSGTVKWGSTSPSGDLPNQFVVRNNEVFFMAETAAAGSELWKSDGTAQGTTMITDLTRADGHSRPRELRTIGGYLYFSADDSVHGRELWRTDGTTDGTHLVADICPGAGSSLPKTMTEMDGYVYFTADDGTHGREIWRTDGTEAGTTLVSDSIPGTAGIDPPELGLFKERLFFQEALCLTIASSGARMAQRRAPAGMAMSWRSSVGREASRSWMTSFISSRIVTLTLPMSFSARMASPSR